MSGKIENTSRVIISTNSLNDWLIDLIALVFLVSNIQHSILRIDILLRLDIQINMLYFHVLFLSRTRNITWNYSHCLSHCSHGDVPVFYSRLTWNRNKILLHESGCHNAFSIPPTKRSKNIKSRRSLLVFIALVAPRSDIVLLCALY